MIKDGGTNSNQSMMSTLQFFKKTICQEGKNYGSFNPKLYIKSLRIKFEQILCVKLFLKFNYFKLFIFQLFKLFNYLFKIIYFSMYRKNKNMRGI